MIYVLWFLCNLGFLLFLLILVGKSTKFITAEYGKISSALFVIGFILLLGLNESSIPCPELNVLKMTPADSVENIQMQNIALETSWLNRYSLAVSLGSHTRTKEVVVLNAYTSRTGLILGGVLWSAPKITVYRINNTNNFHYTASGAKEWRLLRLKVYSQQFTFSGTISPKKD